MTTPEQSIKIAKQIRYDFEIRYKRGTENSGRMPCPGKRKAAPVSCVLCVDHYLSYIWQRLSKEYHAAEGLLKLMKV